MKIPRIINERVVTEAEGLCDGMNTEKTNVLPVIIARLLIEIRDAQ